MRRSDFVYWAKLLYLLGKTSIWGKKTGFLYEPHYIIFLVESIVNQVEDFKLKQADSKASHLPEKALQNKTKNPTGFENGKITLKLVNTRMGRKETFMVAQEIH